MCPSSIENKYTDDTKNKSNYFSWLFIRQHYQSFNILISLYSFSLVIQLNQHYVDCREKKRLQNFPKHI